MRPTSLSRRSATRSPICVHLRCAHLMLAAASLLSVAAFVHFAREDNTTAALFAGLMVPVAHAGLFLVGHLIRVDLDRQAEPPPRPGPGRERWN